MNRNKSQLRADRELACLLIKYNRWFFHSLKTSCNFEYDSFPLALRLVSAYLPRKSELLHGEVGPYVTTPAPLPQIGLLLQREPEVEGDTGENQHGECLARERPGGGRGPGTGGLGEREDVTQGKRWSKHLGQKHSEDENWPQAVFTLYGYTF